MMATATLNFRKFFSSTSFVSSRVVLCGQARRVRLPSCLLLCPVILISYRLYSFLKVVYQNESKHFTTSIR